MKEISRFVPSIIILSGVLLFSDCATLMRKRTQRIPVTSSPVGATVIVNGVPKGVTPLEIGLNRKEKGQVIRIESPGYNPVEIRPQRKMSGGSILGDLLLGLIPATLITAAWGNAQLESMGEVPGSLSDLEAVDGIYTFWAVSTAAFFGLFTFIDRTGDGFTLKPKELIVTLTRAAGPPRVDTIVVGAEDFQNVKWIRVHRD